MQRQPDTLHIPRGNPKAAIRAFVIELALLTVFWFVTTIQVFLLGFHSSAAVRAVVIFCCMVGCIFFVALVVRRIRTFSAAFDSDGPYLTMDGSGLALSLPTGRSLPWSQIEACACLNERYRTILRVFLKSGPQVRMDIDFALAARPRQALDQALLACAAWIAATRDPPVTLSPIRDFVDRRPARRPLASQPPMHRIFLISFAGLCFAATFALFAFR